MNHMPFHVSETILKFQSPPLGSDLTSLVRSTSHSSCLPQWLSQYLMTYLNILEHSHSTTPHMSCITGSSFTTDMLLVNGQRIPIHDTHTPTILFVNGTAIVWLLY
jgi:hypothetical protein